MLRLGQYTALDIINTVLLDGMRTVGKLFGAAQDAVAVGARFGRVMSRPVGLPRAEDGEGVWVAEGNHRAWPTVKGDVHDTGRTCRHHSFEQRIQGGESGDQATRGFDHQGRTRTTRRTRSG